MSKNGVINGVSKYFLMQLLILIICILFINIRGVPQDGDSYLDAIKKIGWISNTVFVLDMLVMHKLKKNILDLTIVFSFFFFLFCNGQIMLYSLGIDPFQMLIFKTSSYKEIYEAAVYFLFSMIVYFMGAIIPLGQKKDINEIQPIKDPRLIAAIRDTSVILIVLSIVPFLYIFLTKIETSLVYGYSALYKETTQVSGIVGYTAKLFIPAMFMLLYVNYNQTYNKRIIHSILLIISVLSLLSGNRGDGLSIIVTLLIIKQLYGEQFTGKKIIKLLLIAVLIIMIIPVLALFRGMENRSISDFGDIFLDSITNSDNNLIISSISELGGTMNAFILTKRAVPTMEGFHYGISYLASIAMIIPSQLMGGFSFAQYAALDIWLQDIHKMSYGPGFSITAETYYNFGWIGGIAFTFLIGLFFSKILNLKSNDNDKNEVLRLLSVIFLYNSIIVARFPFHNTVRNIVYLFIIPYLIIMTIYSRKCRNQFHKN